VTIVLYLDAEGLWRWRLVAPNGEVVASGESHTRKWNAKRAARKVYPGAKVVTEP